jgi:hypothetical protein
LTKHGLEMTICDNVDFRAFFDSVDQNLIGFMDNILENLGVLDSVTVIEIPNDEEEDALRRFILEWARGAGKTLEVRALDNGRLQARRTK